MRSLRSFLQRLVHDEGGQDLIEYALLATFVSLVAIASAKLLGVAVMGWYEAVTRRVTRSSGVAGGSD